MQAYCRVFLFQVLGEGGGSGGRGAGWEEDEEVVKLELLRQHMEQCSIKFNMAASKKEDIYNIRLFFVHECCVFNYYRNVNV